MVAMLGFLSKLFDSNAREVDKLKPLVQGVNGFEESIKKLKDKDLPGKTAEFKKRLQGGESLDTIVPEALATIREAIRRVTGDRYLEQLLGRGVDGPLLDLPSDPVEEPGADPLPTLRDLNATVAAKLSIVRPVIHAP